MSVHVISDRERARKRGGALGWAARRFGALALTLAVLAGVAWISPLLRPTPAPAPDPMLQEVEALRGAKWPAISKPLPERPADVQTAAAPRRRTGIPLNVPHHPTAGDDFDILSAAELAEISQAHPGGATQLAAASQPATRPETADDRARDASDGQDQGRQPRRRIRRR
jgi:hypothetical protein